MRTNLISGAVGLVLAAAVVAGCSNGPDPAPASGPSSSGTTTTPPVSAGSSPVAGEHNPADVVFARQMISHPTQAVAMTDLAAAWASSPQVKDLASRISRGQGSEIEQMNTMLDTWRSPRPQPGPASGMPMDGVMSTR